VLRQVDLLWKTSCLGHAFDIGRIAQEHKLVSFPCCQVCTFSCPTKQFRHVQMRWLDAGNVWDTNRFFPCYVHRKEASALWCLALCTCSSGGTLLMQFLRCSVPNPAWCRLKKGDKIGGRRYRRPDETQTRRRVSRSLSNCLDVSGDDSCRFYLYLMHIYVLAVLASLLLWRQAF
jgi:hypothetical protein